MPEAVIGTNFHAGLFRIQFPWVQIEDDGFALLVHPPEEKLEIRIGKKAKIAAPCQGKIGAGKRIDGEGNFRQSITELKREIRSAVRTIPVVKRGGEYA